VASATPDLRLPSQPQGITAHTKLHCLVTDAHVCVNNLPRVALNSGEARIQTCWSQVPRPNHSGHRSECI